MDAQKILYPILVLVILHLTTSAPLFEDIWKNIDSSKKNELHGPIASSMIAVNPIEKDFKNSLISNELNLVFDGKTGVKKISSKMKSFINKNAANGSWNKVKTNENGAKESGYESIPTKLIDPGGNQTLKYIMVRVFGGLFVLGTWLY